MEAQNGFEKGMIFYNDSQYSKALECFNDEINLNSKNGSAWYYKGKCLEKISNLLKNQELEYSDQIKKLKKQLEKVKQCEGDYQNSDINLRNKSQTYGSYKYYQTTTSQLYWGYSRKKVPENNFEEEILKISDQIRQLSEKKFKTIQLQAKYLEESKECRIRANRLGVF